MFDNDQEMAKSERNVHSKNRSEKKETKLTIRYYIQKIYRKPSEQLSPNRRSLSYQNLTKHMEPQHKKSTPKHKTVGTTTEISPWNDQ